MTRQCAPWSLVSALTCSCWIAAKITTGIIRHNNGFIMTCGKADRTSLQNWRATMKWKALFLDLGENLSAFRKVGRHAEARIRPAKSLNHLDDTTTLHAPLSSSKLLGCIDLQFPPAQLLRDVMVRRVPSHVSIHVLWGV